ncbi:MAG: hypothetical protein ABS36_11485 [Acidobacteria bacterium SCN 69-37]|nr:MAG: hypothetical protein ABS36_11485 [Acidobacteria bacterium SCN 69-37]
MPYAISTISAAISRGSSVAPNSTDRLLVASSVAATIPIAGAARRVAILYRYATLIVEIATTASRPAMTRCATSDQPATRASHCTG